MPAEASANPGTLFARAVPSQRFQDVTLQTFESARCNFDVRVFVLPLSPDVAYIFRSLLKSPLSFSISPLSSRLISPPRQDDSVQALCTCARTNACGQLTKKPCRNERISFECRCGAGRKPEERRNLSDTPRRTEKHKASTRTWDNRSGTHTDQRRQNNAEKEGNAKGDKNKVTSLIPFGTLQDGQGRGIERHLTNCQLVGTHALEDAQRPLPFGALFTSSDARVMGHDGMRKTNMPNLRQQCQRPCPGFCFLTSRDCSRERQNVISDTATLEVIQELERDFPLVTCT